MSTKKDMVLDEKFILNDVEYKVVDPTCFDDLIKALRIREIIETGLRSGLNENGTNWLYDVAGDQEACIQSYLDSLGEFDNSTLIQNIYYLAKKYDLRIGEIENMLGLSAGYISRTAKENSTKKLSIDVVWKIAKLFEVNFEDLISSDLSIAKSNTDMICSFIGKLKMQTDNREIEWVNHGGVVVELNKRYHEIGLDDTKEKTIYYPNGLNPEITWVLKNDLAVYQSFDRSRDLVIVPYVADNNEKMGGYDFLLVWKSGDRLLWKYLFRTIDDPFGDLRREAELLYDSILSAGFDAILKPDAKALIRKYLKNGNERNTL